MITLANAVEIANMHLNRIDKLEELDDAYMFCENSTEETFGLILYILKDSGEMLTKFGYIARHINDKGKSNK